MLKYIFGGFIMKMKSKRLLSLLIALILTVGVLPVGMASAATVITAVNITGYTKPVAGETVRANLDRISVDSKGKGTYHCSWYSYEAEGFMSDNDVFKAYDGYYLSITVDLDSGYEFASNASLTINGSTALVDSKYSVIETSSVQYYTYDIVVDGSSPVKYIDSVAIKGYTTPSVGDTVAKNLANVSMSASGSGTYDFYWYSFDKAANMEASDVFEYGREYYFYAELTPSEGYAFTNDVKVTINGGTSLIDEDFLYTRYNYLEVCAVHEVIGAEYVNKVDVTGFAKPLIGQTAGANIAAMKAANTDKCIYSIVWYKVGSDQDTVMNNSDVFQAGYEYYLSINVEPEDGYVFGKSTKALINSGTAWVDEEYNELYSDWYAYYSINVRATKVRYGDVDGNGKVDAGDALQILRAAVGKTNLTASQQTVAEVSGDNKINAGDALLVLRYAVNKITSFPVEG